MHDPAAEPRQNRVRGLELAAQASRAYIQCTVGRLDGEAYDFIRRIEPLMHA
jgi:hypothetical protein